MKYCIIILLVAIVFSCNFSNKEILDITETEVKEQEKILLSTFFRKIDYVNLEATDDDLIGNISKIVYYKDLLYCLDNISKKIFCFNTEGKYIRKIDYFGRGPNEYTNIDDFFIKEGNIFILNRSRKTIFVYSCIGDFVNKYYLGFYANALINVPNTDNYIAFSPSLEVYEEKDIDPGLSLLSNSLQYLRNVFEIGGNYAYAQFLQNQYLSSYKDSVFVLSPDNIIYFYTSNSANSWKKLDFGDNTLPKNLKSAKNTPENGNKISKSGYVFYKDNLLVNKNYCSFNYIRNNKRYYSFLDSIGSKFISSSILINDLNGFPVSAPIDRMNDSIVMAALPVSKMQAYKEAIEKSWDDIEKKLQVEHRLQIEQFLKNEHKLIFLTIKE